MCLIYNHEETSRLCDTPKKLTLYKVYIKISDPHKPRLRSPFNYNRNQGVMYGPGTFHASIFPQNGFEKSVITHLATEWEEKEDYNCVDLDIGGFHCLTTMQDAETFASALVDIWGKFPDSIRIVEVTSHTNHILAAGKTPLGAIFNPLTKSVKTIVVNFLTISNDEFEKAVK